METRVDPAQALRDLQPQHDFFIGIDSDGCVFDTMEVKHKECFIPNIIKHWDLQAVSKYAREAAEFVNLYSKWRGVNRWPALEMVFDLLRERRDVINRKAAIPQAASLKAFVNQKEFPHSDAGLKGYMAQHPGDPELERALVWTQAVNDSIADMVHGVPPFPYVRESMETLLSQADMMVVSATPVRALESEWHEHQLAQFARVIAGQEMGNKAQHLELAARGRYTPERILMIGDAPGDMKAAKSNGALFFPINPGNEAESWQQFYQESMGRFMQGTYAGAYEAGL
ncbi:MAG: HAD hydrolase-like protein, partial [Chloroflexi bacterium]|nr:HAD hydrolase-like protein [Chloroflexota bacterium]